MREPHQTLAPDELERLWAEHLAGEFENKDVEATLATMVPDAYVNHVVGAGKLVDELQLRFSHEKPMPWLLPGVPATGRTLALDLVVCVEFRGDKLSAERIYWDHASVLRQAGLWRG